MSTADSGSRQAVPITIESSEENCKCSCYPSCTVKWFLPFWWHFFAIITGQWVRPVREEESICCETLKKDGNCNKCCQVIWCLMMIPMMIITLVFIVVNVFPLGAFLTNWISCTETNEFHNVCYTLQFETNKSEVNINNHFIVLKDTNDEDNRFNAEATQQYLQKFEDLTKVFILFAATGSSLSYTLFVWALWCLYFKQIIKLECPSCSCNHSCIYIINFICSNCQSRLRSCCSSFLRCLKCCWKRIKVCRTVFRQCCCCTRNTLKVTDSAIKPFDPFNDNGTDYGSSNIETVYQNNIFIGEGYDDQTRDEIKANLIKQDNDTSTLLQGERLCHFTCWFVIGLSLHVILCGVFFGSYYTKLLKTSQIEIAALFSYAYSLFCTFMSCFIFSKLMYGVQRKCEELMIYVYHVNEEYSNILAEHDVYKYVNDCLTNKAREAMNSAARECGFKVKTPQNCKIDELDVTKLSKYAEDIPKWANDQQNVKSEQEKKFAMGYASVVDMIKKEHDKLFEGENLEEKQKEQIALKYLKERDHHFVKRAVVTMEWFQLWFLFHWVFHILSAFLAIGLFLDGLALHVKAKISHPRQGVNFHPAQIGFLFMLSVVELFQLIYPCLRAATVTRTRQRVIQKLAEESHKFVNIPQGEVMFEFIKSMRERRFSFRLRILCANITFNLNIAYISIIFGFVGVVVSLVTTLTT